MSRKDEESLSWRPEAGGISNPYLWFLTDAFIIFIFADTILLHDLGFFLKVTENESVSSKTLLAARNQHRLLTGHVLLCVLWELHACLSEKEKCSQICKFGEKFPTQCQFSLSRKMKKNRKTSLKLGVSVRVIRSWGIDHQVVNASMTQAPWYPALTTGKVIHTSGSFWTTTPAI